jgi:hypothetical protein
VVTVVLLVLLTVGFGISTLALAAVVGSVIQLLYDPYGVNDPRVKKILTLSASYLAAYIGLWGVAIEYA